MKSIFLIPLLCVLLLSLALPLSSASPLRAVNPSVGSGTTCSPDGNTVPDGVIAPGEYGSDYFDPATDTLLYLRCDNSTARVLHAGIVSPWAGWVGLLVQASDVWDGRVNEVRISTNHSSGAVQVLDAFGNVTAGTTASDLSGGGTFDVAGAIAGTSGAARVYEFAVPLNSTDPLDSQLHSAGPFNFALEYNASDTDLSSPPTRLSGLQSFTIQASGPRAVWTSLEFTAGLPAASATAIDFLVTLRNESGYPVPSAAIEVFLRTAYGMYDIGPVVTNDQGVGEVTYAPRDSGTYVLGAAYAGADGVLASASWKVLSITAPGGSGGAGLSLFNIGGLELRPVEALVVVVVLGVWATYAYAFYVTWGSMRKAHPPPSGPPSLVYSRNTFLFNRRVQK